VTPDRVAWLGFLGSLVYGLLRRSLRLRRGPDFDPIRDSGRFRAVEAAADPRIRDERVP